MNNPAILEQNLLYHGFSKTKPLFCIWSSQFSFDAVTLYKEIGHVKANDEKSAIKVMLLYGEKVRKLAEALQDIGFMAKSQECRKTSAT